MAAATATEEPEAPTSSSNGSADSYIGSLISLTSKSEIRYEGMLFNINTEESNISLRNVRSFGTEGRKKDGPQVPPSDKIYEYILFRGSDIKDLQVKSSPTVQTATPVYNDPAIIQTHYTQAASTSTNLASSGIGCIPDGGSQNLQMGLPRPTFQGNLPLYQPVGGLGLWGSSPPPQTTNGSELALPPMYWQGFSGSSSGFQSQQQSLLRPPPGLSLPPSLQQTVQYPSMSTSLPSRASNMPSLKSSEPQSALLPHIATTNLNVKSYLLPSSTLSWQSSILPTSSPSLQSSILHTSSPSLQSYMLPTSSPSLQSYMLPTSSPSLQSSTTHTSSPLILPAQSALNVGISNLQPPLFPAQTSVRVSDSSTNLVPNKAPSEALPSAASSISLSLASSSTTSFDKITHLSPVSDKYVSFGMPVKTSESFSVAGLSEASSITRTSSSILNEGIMPSLITPGQPFQLRPTTESSTPNPQTSNWDVRSVQVFPGELPSEAPTESKDPLLPLPSPSEYKRGGRMFTRHYNRGRERGRGNRISRPITRFTEDFDFTAMNEKFNKDELWGDLGRNSKEEDNDSQEDDIGSSKPEFKHVYVKDDFFDSLSCDALDRGSLQGRTKFSEHFRKDTETFGHIPRHWSGRGPSRGGRSSGGYYGRGYGYGRGHDHVGRGRTHSFYGRADQ